MNIKIREPQTEEEFSAYYDLRWRILRQPWDQPRGSEKDDKEEEAHHLMAFKNGNPVNPLGVGRIHMNNKEEAQVRYMAVEKEWRRKGIGSSLLKKLEKQAQKWNAHRIVLNARENALDFYKKFNYRVKEKGHTLFGEIPHFVMEKKLTKN